MRRSLLILCLLVAEGRSLGNEACQLALGDLSAKVEAEGTLPGFTYHYPSKVGMGQWAPSDSPFFADPDAVYIGVANTRLMGPHHYYLLAGNTRMDGRVGNTAQMHFVIPQASSLSVGVLFKLKVDKATREKLEASMKTMKDEKSVTCLHAAATALEKAGFKVVKLGDEDKPRTAVEFALNLIEGNVYLDGKKVGVEKLANSKDELKHFLKEARNIDEAMKKRLEEEAKERELANQN